MKFGITLKLFIAFVFTSILAIVTLAVAVRYNFHHGFLDYLNSTEINNLNRISQTLAGIYEENHGWAFLEHNPRAGRRLMRQAIFDSGGSFRRHLHHSMHADDGPNMPEMGLFSRLTLQDKDKRYLAGNPQVSAQAKWIPVKSGTDTVAWLAFNPSNHLTEAVDIQFQQNQTNTGIVISLLSILLAAAIAMVLARHFLSPVKQLVTAMRDLSAGDFAVRINVVNRDELGQLQQDFNSLANILEQHEQTRHRWLADISHELRTPVAILRGEIEAMQDGIRQVDQYNLTSLHNEILRIGKLIEDLYQLSLSDIGALEYHKEPTDILGLINEVIQSFAIQCSQKPLTVSNRLNDCPATRILADPQRMHQLFSNLFQNSLRYTDPGGCVEISCTRQTGSITIHWQDSSPGVSEELLPHLFERLFRVDSSRDRRTGGAGLGLSISKNIVQAHGGDISVQHAPAGGLWFKITFSVLD